MSKMHWNNWNLTPRIWPQPRLVKRSKLTELLAKPISRSAWSILTGNGTRTRVVCKTRNDLYFFADEKLWDGWWRNFLEFRRIQKDHFPSKLWIQELGRPDGDFLAGRCRGLSWIFCRLQWQYFWRLVIGGGDTFCECYLCEMLERARQHSRDWMWPWVACKCNASSSCFKIPLTWTHVDRQRSLWTWPSH